MNKYILCKLKNRTLIQVCGSDSFRFLQSLTTNDLSKIMNEEDITLNKKLLNNILPNKSDSSIYDKISNPGTKYKKLTQGLPSLFLLNNGKILFDCFIYNIEYIHERNFFRLFYIDCNVEIVKLILNVLEKRKLSCDVYFKEMTNIDVYQLLPCISSLSEKSLYDTGDVSNNNDNHTTSIPQGGSSSNITYDGNSNSVITFHNDFLKGFNGEGALFYSRDQRNDLLGYRIYELRKKAKNGLHKNMCETVSSSGNTKEDKNVRNYIYEINNGVINESCDILRKFEAEEKRKITEIFIYDYFKLNLGIIENLYSNYTFFKENTRNNINDANTANNNTTIDSGCVLNNNKRAKNERDLFSFKDLSPFDLNYDKLNYLTKDKGCYVGQEAINRTRNKIFINKYQLLICINYDYYNIFLGNSHNLTKVIQDDFIYYNYLKEICDKNLLRSSFFLLKNALKCEENVINYENQYNVLIQDKHTNSNTLSNNIIGHVFYYNHVMGLCFLIKKKINLLTQNLYSVSSNIYIKNKVNKECHRICLLPFKNNKVF
ncbi:aminomethyltransferase, putative [Plasmodium malariae]|uniref:Aminomethyltransferase, putative n=1 Tax=Plasmodium malariae TaxID=5858 RepID=A0A1C3L1J6_PLAMA|nr:aminomethyltransferase, putative [Plasmodium malariae]